ncbi:alpha/beta hydrolase family protein [Saccharopolyspora sp. MS10]|uniref:alpha/beta hydrolase family protein n=1 Tax=Saccharopolyspora sp. MS10 TaxID=3385973 RepID=UPI00399F09C5
MGRTARLAGALAATAALCLTAPLLPATAAPPAPELALLEPSGPHPVGADTLHLRDESRADPWVPTERRELMLTVWYPASRPGSAPTRYVTPAESRMFLEMQPGAPVEPPEVLSTVRTHATTGAPPRPAGGGRPLVVLSPGFSWPRATLSGLAEELASRGYVVAAIGHNYESAGTEFPDGRVTPCAACENPELGAVARNRAADVGFALDEVLGDPRFGGLVDPERIGVVGHSIGGAGAIEAMRADERIDAGVNLDGTFFAESQQPLDRPFLMVGAGAHAPGGGDDSWDRTWDLLRGWKRWITFNGAGHGSATDVSMLSDQLGISNPGAPLPGARGAELGNRYVAAFLDQHLRGVPRPILDGPTEQHPEVLFWHHDVAEESHHP